MRIQYKVILEDFENELDAVAELVIATGSSSQFSAAARVAAANGLTLLLASIFEEYVRQLVRAVFQEKKAAAQGMEDFPGKLRARMWRTGLERVARQHFTEVDSDHRAARDRVESLLAFCLNGNLSANVEDDLAHNDTNMRPEEIKRLFSQIGMTDAVGKACAEDIVQTTLGAESSHETAEITKTRLKEFFDRRNDVAHALRFGSSSGPTNILSDIELFRSFATGMAQAMDRL